MLLSLHFKGVNLQKFITQNHHPSLQGSFPAFGTSSNTTLQMSILQMLSRTVVSMVLKTVINLVHSTVLSLVATI
jgi:hypothetical protein